MRNYHAEKLSKVYFAIYKTEKIKKAVLSPEKYAFEKLKTQRILLVENDFELELSCQTISVAYVQNVSKKDNVFAINS